MIWNLKLTIGSVINQTQTTFVQGRSILDGPLMMNEIFNMVKTIKKRGHTFQCDFEKVFDSVIWMFLDDIMSQMSFPSTWRQWIANCFK